MFNFSKKILITIGVLIFIYSVLVLIVTRTTINKTLIEQQYFYDIPNLFSTLTSSALIQQDFVTIADNVTKMMNHLGEEFSIGYISVMDTNRTPIKYVISNQFNERAIAYLVKKLESTEITSLKNEYKLENENITEILLIVGSPAVGIIRIGYIWNKVQEKARVVQFALIAVTIIALVIMIVIAIYLNNIFNSEVSSYFFTEKKKAIDIAKQHTLKEMETKYAEKFKRQLETELTQQEIFAVIEMSKTVFLSTDFNENIKIICEWLLKIFNCREIMFYLVDENQQYLYGIYGVTPTGVIEGNAAYEKHIVIGEGELGLAVQHNNFLISDVPKTGYELAGPLIYNDKIIGGISVSNKNNASKKFDSHDKLAGRVIYPLITNIISRFLNLN